MFTALLLLNSFADLFLNSFKLLSAAGIKSREILIPFTKLPCDKVFRIVGSTEIIPGPPAKNFGLSRPAGVSGAYFLRFSSSLIGVEFTDGKVC